MTKNKKCYLGLGSNIGDGKKNLQQAIEKISSIKEVSLIQVAPFYLTKAWGKIDQQDFINSAIVVDTTLTAVELLNALQKIEKKMGRETREKWGPRVIDIDILLYADSVVKRPQLNIPHPYITQRIFVLAPLYDLNKDLYIPNKGKIRQFYDKKCDQDGIIKEI